MRQLVVAIDGIGKRTKFSGNSLLDQTLGGTTAIKLQVSNNTTDTISLAAGAFRNIGVGFLTDTGEDSGNILSDSTYGIADDGDAGEDAVTPETSGQASTLINKINVTADGSLTAASFTAIQTAASAYITNLSTQRSLLGAYQNQIEFTVSNVTELSANLSAARSNVQDTDYASETASLTKGQILQQAATAMLAQANQMPNVILSLLK
jgi:flagellin